MPGFMQQLYYGKNATSVLDDNYTNYPPRWKLFKVERNLTSLPGHPHCKL